MKRTMVRKLVLGYIVICALGSVKAAEIAQSKITEQENMSKASYCMNLLENRPDLEPTIRIKMLKDGCFSEQYVQHSPHVADGRQAVLDLFARRYIEHPDSSIEIKRMVADKDLVWIHLHAKRFPTDRGYAVINIFRMEGGKFIEHWNVAQPVPEKSKNENSMF